MGNMTREQTADAQVFTVTSGESTSDAVNVPAGVISMLTAIPTITSGSTVKAQVMLHGTTEFYDLYNVDNVIQGRSTLSTGSFSQPFVFFGRPKQVRLELGVNTGAGGASIPVTFSA